MIPFLTLSGEDGRWHGGNKAAIGERIVRLSSSFPKAAILARSGRFCSPFDGDHPQIVHGEIVHWES
jgi:hypothetical protein